MKMHFSIPLSEELLEKFGGRYVLYSVYLEGFLFCKARYSQLHRWNEQDTFKIQPQKACLDVYLADGRNIRLDIKTSDTAERILEVASYKMGLSRELIGYFSLFFIEDHNSGTLSVVKKVAEFELPYVSLQSMKQSHCKLGIRKWYMDPSLDKMLLDCRASVNLLYMQAVQEIERNWVKPTDEQMQKLELLQKTANKIKFLELVSEVQHYGYIKLDPCTCDYPEVGCSADVHVGNNEIYCCVKLPTNQTKVISFKINRVRCWQVTFLGAVTDANDEGTGETLELRFEYNDSDTWKWIVFYTKQAFLLSSCFKKMISEQLMKTTKEQELQIEMPETSKSKNSSIQQNQFRFTTLDPMQCHASEQVHCVAYLRGEHPSKLPWIVSLRKQTRLQKNLQPRLLRRLQPEPFKKSNHEPFKKSSKVTSKKSFQINMFAIYNINILM
ncbi:sorting nexin-31 isoform X3 [Alligator mississippiensis]|uniref:sorting nexin-31 isoform X3 n=1 Tax=Alligator mississippiensis TaxID=8496 RepID=UPI002877F3CF|nr:sorting nexin-31 isoform X3 [Alligator mississippiensis]